MYGPLEGTHPDHRGLNMHIWGWRVSSGCGFIMIASLHCHKSLAKPWKGADILHSKVCMPCVCVMAHMWKSEYNMGVALGLLPCLRRGHFVVSHHVACSWPSSFLAILSLLLVGLQVIRLLLGSGVLTLPTEPSLQSALCFLPKTV